MGHDYRLGVVSAEPRCLQAMEANGRQLAGLSGQWGGVRAESAGAVGHDDSSRTEAEARAAERCARFSGCATSALLVTAAESYASRVESELGSAFPTLRGRWGACVPTVCLAFGKGHLLRSVLGKLVLVFLHGLQALQLHPPREAELSIELVASAPELLDAHDVHAADSPQESGLCICSDEAKKFGFLTASETAVILSGLADRHRRPGLLRKLGPMIVDYTVREYPERLARLTPSTKCYFGVDTGTVNDMSVEEIERDCVPGRLNQKIVEAVAAFYAKINPSTFLNSLDRVLLLAQIMADCPMAALASYAGAGGIAPLDGFNLAGALEKSRAAHLGFLRGSKVLGDPLMWTGPSDTYGRPICNRELSDRSYLARAIAVPTPRNTDSGPRKRIGCLYAAVWPADRAQIGVVGQTFARHCDWARFFVAPGRSVESRRSWRLRRHSRGESSIINLAEIFPEARPDVSKFMKTASSWSPQRWWSGNTIQKYLLISLYAADHLQEAADVFCLLELDSAFIADNLRAFARAEGLHVSDPVFLASLNMGSKFRVGVGVFPHTAGGICLTAEAIRRLGSVLRPLPKTEVVYRVERNPDDTSPVFRAGRLAKPLSQNEMLRLHSCAFVAGHWWDVMIGRCLRAANVSAHPSLEDPLGRYYFTSTPLPCREHLDVQQYRKLLQMLRPQVSPTQRRFENLAGVICAGPFGFGPEMHRYAACEPAEHAALSEYWVSPFAIGFHGYKNLTLHLHAYRILYEGATCDWVSSYRPRVAASSGI